MNYIRLGTWASGGRWWLDDQQWKALEADGWEVEWTERQPAFDGDPEPGTLAMFARLRGVSLETAMSRFANATEADPKEIGCPCCGQPFVFTEFDESGEFISHIPSMHFVFGVDPRPREQKNDHLVLA